MIRSAVAWGPASSEKKTTKRSISRNFGWIHGRLIETSDSSTWWDCIANCIGVGGQSISSDSNPHDYSKQFAGIRNRDVFDLQADQVPYRSTSLRKSPPRPCETILTFDTLAAFSGSLLPTRLRTLSPHRSSRHYGCLRPMVAKARCTDYNSTIGRDSSPTLSLRS